MFLKKSVMKRNVKLKSRKNPKLLIEERDYRELICLCTACRNAWLASLNLSCFIYFLPHISAIRNSIPEFPLKLVKVLAEVTTFSSKAEGKRNKLFFLYLVLISAFAHEVRLGFFRYKFSYCFLVLRPGIKLRAAELNLNEGPFMDTLPTELHGCGCMFW